MMRQQIRLRRRIRRLGREATARPRNHRTIKPRVRLTIQAHRHRRDAAALPRPLRAHEEAAAHVVGLQHVRPLRLHEHRPRPAREPRRHARRARDGHVADVPARTLPRIQGAAREAPRGHRRIARARRGVRPRGPRAVPPRGGVRGGRPHGHARRARRGRRLRDVGRLARQGHGAARHGPRHALPPVARRGREGRALRPDARLRGVGPLVPRADGRPARHGGRLLRQHPRLPGHRPQDRLDAPEEVRLARGRRRARVRDQGQDRRDRRRERRDRAPLPPPRRNPPRRPDRRVPRRPRPPRARPPRARGLLPPVRAQLAAPALLSGRGGRFGANDRGLRPRTPGGAGHSAFAGAAGSARHRRHDAARLPPRPHGRGPRRARGGARRRARVRLRHRDHRSRPPPRPLRGDVLLHQTG